MSPAPLPELNLDHLLRLTDCTGIIQHACYSLPDRSTGYTTDDNARALIVALDLYRESRDMRALRLAERYLGFLSYAQNAAGKFRNFVDYSRRFLDEEGSEDAFGRSLWACGYTLENQPGSNLACNARRLMDAAFPWVSRLRAPRAKGYCLLGLCHLLTAQPDHHRAHVEIRRLSDSLVDQYRQTAGDGWHWFEDYLTYSNAVLPMSLFLAYQVVGKKSYLSTAVESLSFLADVVCEGDRLRLVGNRGWLVRGGTKAPFDEQPVDAALTVLAALTAHRVTGKQEYNDMAEIGFAWFLGRNAAGVPLYDPETGGGYDGLTPDGVNRNQGAESLLAYFLAYLAILEARQGKRKGVARSGA